MFLARRCQLTHRRRTGRVDGVRMRRWRMYGRNRNRKAPRLSSAPSTSMSLVERHQRALQGRPVNPPRTGFAGAYLRLPSRSLAGERVGVGGNDRTSLRTKEKRSSRANTKGKDTNSGFMARLNIASEALNALCRLPAVAARTQPCIPWRRVGPQ